MKSIISISNFKTDNYESETKNDVFNIYSQNNKSNPKEIITFYLLKI